MQYNSGGLVVTIVDGKPFTVGLCRGNFLRYFSEKSSVFAVDTKDKVTLVHEMSGMLSTIISPTHIHGLIVRADTFWKKLVEEIVDETVVEQISMGGGDL